MYFEIRLIQAGFRLYVFLYFGLNDGHALGFRQGGLEAEMQRVRPFSEHKPCKRLGLPI
jgi:hypothetical protein